LICKGGREKKETLRVPLMISGKHTKTIEQVTHLCCDEEGERKEEHREMRVVTEAIESTRAGERGTSVLCSDKLKKNQ
jgi:hypothetical protein